MQGVFVSVAAILLCIVMLCSATFAWFSDEHSISGNTMAAGTFDLSVSLEDSSDNVIVPTKNTDGTMTAILPQAESYLVTVTITEDTTVSQGFCVIEANDVSQSTQLIKKGETITFRIVTTSENETVIFKPVWGVPSNVSIMQGQIINID